MVVLKRLVWATDVCKGGDGDTRVYDCAGTVAMDA
jgi:hypothetical protein